MKAKKSLAVILTIVMIFTMSISIITMSTGVVMANTGQFSDISEHWAESIINEAAGLGIVGGYPEGDFKPDNLMKREEFFKLMTNVLSTIPDTSNTTITFSDVDPIEWYVPTVKTAVAAGITSGYDDGTFGIGIMISRQEAAKVVASVIDTENLTGTASAAYAADKDLISDWAYSYVDIMFKKGYMQGDTEGNFRPTSALTRAEAATMLLNVKKNETTILGPNQKTGTTATTGTEVIGSEGGCLATHTIANGAFERGSGSKSDPYVISAEAQLNHVREHMDAGIYFILAKDITITSDFAATAPVVGSGENNWSNGNFVPIGTQAKPFIGGFDGNKKTIYGLNITGTIRESSKDYVSSYTGLFGYVGTSGIINDVTVDKATITGNQYTGGIAGYSAGTITGCTLGVDGVIVGATNTGGIVGYAQGTLTDNTNQGKVTGTSINSGGIVGSMVGSGQALLNCVNKGRVNGIERVGGVAGDISGNGNAITVKSCNNSGTVLASSNNAGGIAGRADGSNGSVTISNSYNTGSISESGVNGGITGYNKGSKVTIQYCYNDGEVDGGSAGGITGNNEGTIEYSANNGSVTGKNGAGGIAAFQEDDGGKITKCYNDGKISSTSFAGGIIGTNKTKVNNCYNTGKISGTNSVGGIAGKNEGYIQNTYNIATVSASNGAGALIGRNAGEVEDSYWLEEINLNQIGLTDASSSQSNLKKLTVAQLSGTEDIKVSSVNMKIIALMNDKAGSDIWEQASGSYNYPSIINLGR